MNHSIHTLASLGLPNGKQQQHLTMQHQNQQHQQNHLAAQQQQQQQQHPLHFVGHPYATLHQHSHSGLSGLSSTHLFANSSSSSSNASSSQHAHTLKQQAHRPLISGLMHSQNIPQMQQQQQPPLPPPHQQHIMQQQQQQQQQSSPQQYNMNSDYSSSTYHIYDQISDLIIIKQQRLERRRQLEQRRKVMLVAVVATLLVSSLAVVILQSIFGSSPSTTTTTTLSTQQSRIAEDLNRSPQHQLDDTIYNNNNKDVIKPNWQPSPADYFDASKFPINARLPQDVSTQMSNIPVIPTQLIDTTSSSSSSQCNGRGRFVRASGQCECESGFYGPACEKSVYSAIYKQPQQLTLYTRCMVTTFGCYEHGTCNQYGRCQCFAPYTGPKCEHTLPVIQPSSVASSAAADQPARATGERQQQQVITQQQPAQTLEDIERQKCALLTNNCSGQGQCDSQGVCKCFAGFAGLKCQERDLCYEQSCSNNQGVCVPATGACLCHMGFKGAQCEQRDEEALAKWLNCSSNGKFDHAQRKCVCSPGFAGADCSEERCENGDVDQQQQCGPNGLYDCKQQRCVCKDGYSGALCQVQECSAQCLRNGRCLNGKCVCRAGFYGKHCSLNGCPNGCSQRGECMRIDNVANTQQESSWTAPASNLQQAPAPEWRCECQPGAEGEDCSRLVERTCDDNIDNDKDGLVDCADSECCSDKACQNSTLCTSLPGPLDILMRINPAPPTSSFFQRMQFLVDKQLFTSSKEFNDSSPLGSRHVDRASVLRGRVTYMRQGITGVRVEVAGQDTLGATVTRDGGYFDLMTHGGGAVLLEFRREPFVTKQVAVRVPWNEIVLVDTVELSLDTTSDDAAQADAPSGVERPSCMAHNYKLMHPRVHVVGSEKRAGNGVAAALPTSRAAILRDSGVVKHSIQLPGSQMSRGPATDNNESVWLTYMSSRANEFMSTIQIQLTDSHDKIPAELKLIHLRIVIEGNLYEQVFEPQTNLSFTYAWNRRNVYRQKSFGVSTAQVYVGYEYFDCARTIWAARSVQLAGHDLSISDIGSAWNLNIHYRYNYRDAILQRGDGLSYNLKTDKAHVVHTLMGDGEQRQAQCAYCDGASTPAEQRLLRPQALVSAADGSVIVADYNLVRRIEPPLAAPAHSRMSPASQQQQQQHSQARVVRTLLELPASRVPARYALAISPSTQRLYMADPERGQVYLMRHSSSSGGSRVDHLSGELLANDSLAAALEDQLQLVAGSAAGQKCGLAGESDACGDGQSALLARLAEPRALAIDLAQRMYIADGANVRVVELDTPSHKIYTLLGDYSGRARAAAVFPCNADAIPMHKFAPQAPQDLAVSPVDDALHILDADVVYKITADKRVQIVAGKPAHCGASTQPQHPASGGRVRATEMRMHAAQAIAFAPNGDIYVTEEDASRGIARVLLVSPDENVARLYAGAHASSTGGSVGDEPSNALHQPATQATRALEHQFHSVAGIAVDPQGKLLVADRAALRVFSVEPDLAAMNALGEYEIASPDAPNELLVFNRHGHHVATRATSAVTTSAAATTSTTSTPTAAADAQINWRALMQRPANKYTFSYNVNTPFAQLQSVGYASGNKISVIRDGSHHAVKMIETNLGGTCKLDVSRAGQLHSISLPASASSMSPRTSFAYHSDGSGLLKQSRDTASGEVFEFAYDEFGHAQSIQRVSPLSGALTCHASISGQVSAQCAQLIHI